MSSLFSPLKICTGFFNPRGVVGFRTASKTYQKSSQKLILLLKGSFFRAADCFLWLFRNLPPLVFFILFAPSCGGCCHCAVFALYGFLWLCVVCWSPVVLSCLCGAVWGLVGLSVCACLPVVPLCLLCCFCGSLWLPVCVRGYLFACGACVPCGAFYALSTRSSSCIVNNSHPCSSAMV